MVRLAELSHKLHRVRIWAEFWVCVPRAVWEGLTGRERRPVNYHPGYRSK